MNWKFTAEVVDTPNGIVENISHSNYHSRSLGFSRSFSFGLVLKVAGYGAKGHLNLSCVETGRFLWTMMYRS